MTVTKQQPEMILASSPEAASIQTVTGWVSRGGRFWGDDEHMARYCGSTHRLCEANPEHGPVENRSYCEACHAEKNETKWQAMPKAPLSEELLPLCVFDSDNDVYASIWDERDGATIEFCTPGQGGGKSSRTRMALLAVMVAMEADNAADPGRDWWAERNRAAQAKEGGA